MHKLLSQIPIENIHKLLPDSIEKSKVKSLEELTASSSLSETRKRFYKLSLDGSPDLHLSYGKGLSDAYERSKAFYSNLPDLTCKPLFLVKDGTYELFAQEFFEGIPIDESFEAGTTSDPEVTKILKTLESSFASIERSSTKEDMNKEFQQHKDSVLNNDNFGDLDREYRECSCFGDLSREYRDAYRSRFGDLDREPLRLRSVDLCHDCLTVSLLRFGDLDLDRSLRVDDDSAL